MLPEKFKSSLAVTAAFVLAVVLSCCRVPPELNTEKTITTPDAFVADTAYHGNQQQVKWREYFKDENLVSLLDTALRYNQDLQKTYQRIFAAMATFTASRNAMYPQFQAGISAGVTRFGDYTMDGVGNFDTNLSSNISSDQQIPNPVPDYYAGAGASWETGLWGRLKNRKKGAYNRFLASVQGQRLLTTQLVAEVATMYYELITLDTQLEIIRRNIALQERAVELITIQKESGRINELGVKQFQAQLLRSKTLAAIKIQEIIAAENALNFMVGRYPRRIVRKDTLDLTDLPPMILTGVPSELLKSRPDIQRAELEFVASVHDLRSARAGFYPRIVITANAGMNAFNTANWFNFPASAAYSVFGGLAAPVLNRPQLMADYRRAYASKNEQFLEYQKVIINSIQEVSTGMNRVMNYRRASALKSEEVRILIEAVAVSNELFLTGYANYMEVLIARQNRLESELQLTETHKQQFLSAVFLYRAMGGGWQ